MNKEFKDIQSLRALAVTLVLAYHLQGNFFKFGYLGVDIFFVISGFIITHIIIKNGFKNILKFYVKRINRIYPAMTLVILSTVVVGYIFLRSDELVKVGTQGFFSLFGIANFYFSAAQTGYFEIESFQQPLLHLWSLSTEIQFYILWPLILFIILKLERKIQFYILIFISILSLMFHLKILGSAGLDSYYLISSRLWEFILGSIIALINYRQKITVFKGQIIFLVSLILILALNIINVPLLNNSIIEIIIVFLSAFMILQSISNGNTGKNFTPKITNFLGELSYSIYLWHWPVLYFLKNLTSMSDVTLTLFTVLLSVLFSIPTYYLWENRFRGTSSRKQRFVLPLFIIFTLIVSSAVLTRTISDQRFSGQKKNLANFNVQSGFTDKESKCISDYDESFEVWDEECLSIGMEISKSKALIWGDSHVAAIADAFDTDSRFENMFLARASTTACPPIVSLEKSISPNNFCKINNDFVWNYIESEKPNVLILVARWYIYANYEWYESGLRALQVTIDEAQKLGVENIILVGSSPEWGESLPGLLWKLELAQSGDYAKLPNTRVSNLRDINFNLKDMASAASIQYVDPLDLWCELENCLTYRDRDNFYTMQIDEDHLSIGAGKEIVQTFILK